jgi:stage II sporulation protein D
MVSSLLASVLVTGAMAAVAPADHGGTRWSIRGAGWGHGVGMSQHGALGMAEQGRSHRAILAHYYRGTAIGRTAERPVRVLVREQAPRVSFRGATRACGRRLLAARTYRAVQERGRVVLRSAGGRRLRDCGARLVATGGQSVELRGEGRYRGAVEVRPEGARSVVAVNVVALEQYLRGVVPGEMPASWPAAALRAQAIAARTYAISTSAGGEDFDQHADVRSQVYLGMRGEHPATDAAIRGTRGRVVTYGRRPAVTYYHSTSGGRTEDVELVFPDSPAHPWLRGVADPYDAVSPVHRWGPLRLSSARMDQQLDGLVRGSLLRVHVRRRGRSSPRILSAELIGTGGRTAVTGAQLRARLGLRDTWAFFARVTTYADRGAITGRVAPSREAVTLQRRSGGRWLDHREIRVRRDGRYRARVAAGRWRVVHGGWAAGPAVRVR